jgi:hypothetical protein
MNTGPEAIAKALEGIDIDALEQEQIAVIKSKKKTARPRAVRLLNIIHGLRTNNLHPKQLMLRSVPVIPPKFRPFAITGDTFLPGDANELYRDLVEYRRLYERTAKELGPENAGDVYADMVQAVRAAYGYGDSPNPKTKARAVKGFFTQVVGTNPKTSFLQSRMLSKPVDTVGRGVVIPDADYDMDEVGLPAEMAWKLYGNYVQRRLVRSGMSPAAALKHVKERSPQAQKALETEMPDRPVILTRSPAWHRYSVVGQVPRIVEGDAIKVNNYVSEGLNMDYDGDDQLNTVLCAVTREYFSYLQSHFVDVTAAFCQDTGMFNKLHIPTLDTNTHVIGFVDLEDFPHAELLGEKDTAVSHIEFFKAAPGVKVIAYDEQTNQAVWADVALWSRHNGPKVEIVTLENRRQIFTDDDPRAVYGVNPRWPFVLARFTPSEALAAKVAVPVVKDASEVLASRGTVGVVNVGPLGDQMLDYEFGWLLGALCGAGWWDEREFDFYRQRRMQGTRSINLADLGGESAERLKSFIQSRLDPEVTLHYHRQEHRKQEGDDRYGDTVRHTFNFRHSEALAAFMDTHLGRARDGTTSGSANKKSPSFLFQAPVEFRRGFLCGMVDTAGTCSVTYGKGRPQLQCAISSTSLRLVRELQMLCRSLGVRSHISFSKVTTAGNASWLLNMSAADCKRLSLFSDLATSGKRKNFMTTAVSQDKTSPVHDKVVVPAHVHARIARDLPFPKIYPEERKLPDGRRSESLLSRMEAQSLYQLWRSAGKDGVVSRAAARRALDAVRSIRDAGALKVAEAIQRLRDNAGGSSFDADFAALLRGAIQALAPHYGDPVLYKAGTAVLARLNRPLRDGMIGTKVCRGVLAFLESTPPYQYACDDPEVQVWETTIVNNELVSWSPVVSVEKTGKSETGYDLTVPGYETFMSADGVILSNTASIHVPSSPAAVKETREKLMASKMIWSIKDRSKTLANPKHESLLGLNPLRRSGDQPGRHAFATEEEAMRAIENGDVALDDEIEIG